MLNVNNICSFWKHARCQNERWLAFKPLYFLGFGFLDLKHRLMYSCSVSNNVTLYKLRTFYNFYTNLCHPKINKDLVKISYFFQLHDTNMQNMYFAFFSTYHIQSSSRKLKLAGRGSGERRRKWEVQGMRPVPVLWHAMSVKNTSPKHIGH
jgi:hypothetical protein